MLYIRNGEVIGKELFFYMLKVDIADPESDKIDFIDLKEAKRMLNQGRGIKVGRTQDTMNQYQMRPQNKSCKT